MNEKDLSREILDTLGFEPTEDQRVATQRFAEFMFMTDAHVVMLMCGCAGTGKTSLAAAMVRTLERLGQRIVLLAPTGRAAKVFSLTAGRPAHTIHRKIYRQDTFQGVDTTFQLGDNRMKNTLFVVDEASMISNEGGATDLFGSGRLLDDLMEYVYSGTNCRLMLIGDKAQLPPVRLVESPALEKTVLEGYNMTVVSATLDEVLRQSQESGILYNATRIRKIITGPQTQHKDSPTLGVGFGGTSTPIPLPKIRLSGFPDLHVIRGDELIESLCGSHSKVGMDGTMVVTRSNKRANVYNKGIRSTILGREEELTVGDRLMVVKNNYFWTDLENEGRDKDDVETVPTFLANGDVAIVKRVRNFQEQYGFHFADVTLEFPDYDDYEISVKVVLDSLMSESPALTREEQTKLFDAVVEDYAHIKNRKTRYRRVREDMFYNALQVKFAYAVTCHKSQGGQWEHVYIDQGYIGDDNVNEDYVHWLYTAFTRATKELFLVNWPTRQREE